MSDEKPPYPDTINGALVTDALQDILAYQFSDRLDNGKTEFPDGNTEKWAAAREAAVAGYRGRRTQVDLILAQAYITAASPAGDVDKLYNHVVALASYALDWAELLKERVEQ